MVADLPAAALVGVSLVTHAGETLTAKAGLARLAATPHIVCHAAFLVERLANASGATRHAARAAREQKHFDVAELFAFVCPARVATPTPLGLARALALEPATSDVATLRLVAGELLGRLANQH